MTAIGAVLGQFLIILNLRFISRTAAAKSVK